MSTTQRSTSQTRPWHVTLRRSLCWTTLLLTAGLAACSDSEGTPGGGSANNAADVGGEENNAPQDTGAGDEDTSEDQEEDVAPVEDEPTPMPQCEEGEARCADLNTLERCEDPLAGFVAEPCPEGQLCQGGACQDPACEVGARQCLGLESVQQCEDVEGIPTLTVTDCGDGEVCFESQCLPQVCDPDAPPTCQDENTALFCDPPGVAERPQACFQGQICLNNGCQTQLCNPGTTICRGETIERCNEQGTAYDELETCDPINDGTTCIEGQCVDPCTAAELQNSYLGCRYTALDLPNSSTRLNNGYGIVVTNPSPTQTATATITVNGQLQETLTIAPRSAANYVDTVRSFRLINTGVTNNAFRVVSDIPVAVYQFNVQRTIQSASTDASLLFPDHALFNQYLAMTYSGDNIGSGSEAYISIVAIEPETEVTITPTTTTQASTNESLVSVPVINAGSTQTISLDQFQVLNLIARPGTTDLTGTQIIANQPIAVFGGNKATQVPTGRRFRDHIEQQIFPRQALGERYIVNKSRARRSNPPDYIRVMADIDNVEVTFNPAVRQPVVLNTGEFVEVAIDDHVEVNSTGPVAVGQFFAGSNGAESNSEGDPTFVMQVPIEQYRDNYVIFCPDTYTSDYLSITAPIGAEVLLDGVPQTLSQTPIGESNLSVTIIELADGDHELTGTLPFGVLVYGFGGPPNQDPNNVQNVSYGYPGGLNLIEINPKE